MQLFKRFFILQEQKSEQLELVKDMISNSFDIQNNQKFEYTDNFYAKYTNIVPADILNKIQTQNKNVLFKYITKYANDISIKYFKVKLSFVDYGDNITILGKKLKPESEKDYLAGGRFYHITPLTNFKTILSRGLVPKSSREVTINYPPSIFLFKSLPTEKELIQLGRLFQSTAEVGIDLVRFSNHLALYEVNLPKTYKAFVDPNSHDYDNPWYYVNKAIPSRFIKFIKIL